ncbi:MAG: hypothetical protein KBT34_05420 [Prevotella sp.]|nr:hypothetical protein [Candidatus Prevotella equi]
MKENAAKMVSEALLGVDGQEITIKGKVYIINPPTIKQIVGAGRYLAEFGDEGTTGDFIKKFQKFDGICKAVSWFLVGSEDIYKELEDCTLDETLKVLEIAFGMIGIQNFIKLSTLAKNVKMAIAKQR